MTPRKPAARKAARVTVGRDTPPTKRSARSAPKAVGNAARERTRAKLLAAVAQDLRPGDVIVVDLPWVAPEEQYQFERYQDGAPLKAGAGVGNSGVWPWPRDYSGVTVVCYLIEADTKYGKKTSGQYAFPAEAVRAARGTVMTASRVTGGSGKRAVRVCAVDGCEHFYVGVIDPAVVASAGLTVSIVGAGKVPLCRKHKTEALASST